MSTNLFPSIFQRRSLSRFPSLLQERFPTFLQELEQMVQDAGGTDQGLTVYEEKSNIIVEASVPGLKPEEIEVTLSRGILWIKGEKQEEESDKSKKFYRKSTRSFSYSVALPDQIDEKQEPKAAYKNGILTITFQKAKSTEAKRIDVKT